MIELIDIRKTYVMGDQHLDALHDINETIPDGEHVVVMGPSGSGKSTLLNIIGCLDRPTSGEYHLDGREVATLPDDELARVRLHELGFIFQSFHLVPRLDALANVALPMLFAGIPAAERRERAEAALESVGLANWATHRPGELSGGQKQRVAIARAVVMRPNLLLADEPTGNLDSASGRQVLDLIGDLNRSGITLITVSHDPEVARMADRVIVIRDGAIVRRVAGTDVVSLDMLFAPVDGEPRDNANAPAEAET